MLDHFIEVHFLRNVSKKKQVQKLGNSFMREKLFDQAFIGSEGTETYKKYALSSTER